MISLEKINKKYQDVVLSNFSYVFKSRGLFAILGDSGSGKSTLLNIISGVDKQYTGLVKIDGINLKLLHDNEDSVFRLNNIGYIFQDFRLLNLLSVTDNVMFNLDAMSTLSKSLKEKMVQDALAFVGLENKGKAIINQLSGGEKQRVAIARAIASSPRYLLCDEPTGNLDDKNAEEAFKLLKAYSESHTVILVSHDQEKVVKYADEIIHLKDGTISQIDVINKIDDIKLPSIRINRKLHISLSFSLRLRSGFRKIKERKWRSVFTNLVSSISLLALGAGIIITTSLRSQILDSFSNVVNANQIVVSKKSTNPNPYTSYSAADEEVAYSIAKDYDAYIYGVGSTYLNNFNVHFPNRDQVYLLQGDKKIVLPSYHSSLFNSYLWPEDKYIERFYPRVSGEIGIDEVVLGLPYMEMINLCIKLQLERTYEALGSYLATHTVRLFLGIDNLDWGYENDIEFRLISVYPSVESEIWHTNHFFNAYVFELEAQMPTTSDIESEPSKPWTLKKVFTLHLTEMPTYLNESIQFNHRYDDIVLESAQNFLSDECIISEDCWRNVVFVFTIDKNAVDISDIINFKKITSKIKSYLICSNSGYQVHPSGMIEGFANNIGFSFSEDTITEVADYFSKDIEGEMEEFPGSAIGGLTRFNKNGVLFSSDFANLIRGELPKDYNEIVISSGLVNYLGYSKDPLYEELFYCMYSHTLKNTIINRFKVVGIIDNEKNYIYHQPLFSVSFFRDKLGISSFNLIPSSIILNLTDNEKMDLLMADLSSSFKEYNFTSPLQEISATVDEVMNYVNTIAIIFSSIALVISVLLLALISYLNAIEAKGEIDLLKHLGHSRRSIREYISSHSLAMAIITTTIAIFELLIFQVFISLFLGSYLGLSTSIVINVLPFFAITIVGLILPIVISALITNFTLNKIKDN